MTERNNEKEGEKSPVEKNSFDFIQGKKIELFENIGILLKTFNLILTFDR